MPIGAIIGAAGSVVSGLIGSGGARGAGKTIAKPGKLSAIRSSRLPRKANREPRRPPLPHKASSKTAVPPPTNT